MPARVGQATLSREDVVERALRLVEEQGADQLTVRGLAAQLSVAVTSIYWHVGDKEALLDAVVDRIVERFGEVEVRGRDPRSRVRSAARSLRRMLSEQADLVALVNRRGRINALMLPAQVRLWAELAEAGLRGDELALAVQAVIAHVVGNVLVERQVERQPAHRQSVAQLWPEAPPELVAAIERPPDDERQFLFALDALLDGMVGPAAP